MKVDFRTLANQSVRHLTPYQPGKPTEELERELGISSAIKLASNENPLGSSPKVSAAIKKALLTTHIYPDGGCYEFKHTLSKSISVRPEQITVGNGSENILELIVKAYLHQGDNAVISEFAFLTIPLLLKSYGITIKVAKANNWSHDVNAMLKQVDKKTRVLFLVNPNNPTGTYTHEKDFLTLMESIPPHILVVVDEAYFEYISVIDYPQTLSLLNTYPNLVVTRTFSKAYGLASLRLGYAVSSPEIADILNRVRLPFNVNTIAVKAACAALEDQAHVSKSVQLTYSGKLQVIEELRCNGLRFIQSMGNFVSVDVGDGQNIYQKLLREGIIVRPLHAYSMPKHIRVTIGTYEQNERFLTALLKVMP